VTYLRTAAFVAAITLLAFATLAASQGTRAGETIQGDADCSGEIDAHDSLVSLRLAAGADPGADCAEEAGDVNCDSAVDEQDVLGLLLHVGGINGALVAGACTAIGDVLPPPTGTPSISVPSTPDPTPSATATATATPTGTGEGTPTHSPTITTTTTATATPTPTATPSTTPSGPTPEADRYHLEEVISAGDLGVATDYKTELALIPGSSDEAILALQTGQIYRISLSGDPSPVLWGDLSSILTTHETPPNEMGLLSVAFSPNFIQDHVVYAYYTPPISPPPRVTRLSRFTATTTDLTEESQTTVIDIEDFDHRHQGGHIIFDDEGNLLLSLGDGGFSGDSQETAQNLGRLLGKVIRIDVSPLPYTIPQDNPFVGMPGVREEIFAYGFRNPWRMTADSLTGEMWVGDVGEGAWEEVDHVIAGGNYGWDCYEGYVVYETPGPSPPNNHPCTGPFVTPRAVYNHSQGNAIVGGYVYRGSEMPELYGWYVYADYTTARVWAVNTVGSAPPVQLTNESGYLITSFAEIGGELYVVSRQHGIYKLERD
jgi:glucose/arabinose dehydrogenase